MTIDDWLVHNGPLYCPRCGELAQVELLDTDTRPCEALSCDCGEGMQFVHPPFGAVLPLLGVGLIMARSASLAPWRARPSGVRRWPRLARLLAPRPQQTRESWTWEEADWPPICEIR
jgi:hypothetical protein